MLATPLSCTEAIMACSRTIRSFIGGLSLALCLQQSSINSFTICKSEVWVRHG